MSNDTVNPKPALPKQEPPKRELPANDIRRKVVDRLWKAVEDGNVPWARCWSAGPNGPRNVVTGMPYKGLNSNILTIAAMERELPRNWWLTEAQAKRLGGELPPDGYKTGEDCIKWYEIKVGRRKKAGGTSGASDAPDAPSPDDEEEDRTIMRASGFRVYHVDSFIDQKLAESIRKAKEAGIEFSPETLTVTPEEGYVSYQDRVNERIAKLAPVQTREIPPDERWEIMRKSVTERTGVKVLHGDFSPAYHPGQHKATLPSKERFEDLASYAWVYAHEVAGHGSERQMGVSNGAFGSKEYAKCELRAHMIAGQIAGEAGLLPDTPETAKLLEREAAYLKSWLIPLVRDPQAFCSAASQATKAVEMLVPDEVRRELGLIVADDYRENLEAEQAAIAERRKARKAANPDGMTRAQRKAANRAAFRAGKWDEHVAARNAAAERALGRADGVSEHTPDAPAAPVTPEVGTPPVTNRPAHRPARRQRAV